MKRDICVPISAAQALAESLELRQVIIVAWDGVDTHVVTYGGSVTDSANAAAGGNMVKKALGWPEHIDTESTKVLALKAQLDAALAKIAELQADLITGGLPTAKLPKVDPVVHVIEGTEYERGWGQRPDGFVAFTTKEAAKAWITDYNRTYNNAMAAPDEYTTYMYIGGHPCSQLVWAEIAEHGMKHMTHRRDLMA